MSVLLSMNGTLASKVEHCAVARCLELYRFNNDPLVFDDNCLAFAAHFLKLGVQYGINCLLNSSNDFPSCVRFELNEHVNVKTAAKIQTSIGKLTERSARAEAQRAIFPVAFAEVRQRCETKKSEMKGEEKLDHEAYYGHFNWRCFAKDSLSVWADKKASHTLSVTSSSRQVTVWMSPQDRLGLIAHIINREPGLKEFMPLDQATRPGLPLLVFEMMSTVTPNAYRSLNDTKEEMKLALFFHSRNYANGGMLIGLPFRDSFKHPFATATKDTVKPSEVVLTQRGGVAAFFGLFSRVAKSQALDATHFDGFMHAAMTYAMEVAVATVNNRVTDATRGRTEVLPPIVGTEIKSDYRTARQYCKLACDDIAPLTVSAVNVFMGRISPEPDNIRDATRRGLCRQNIPHLDGFDRPQRWQSVKFTHLSPVDAEKILASHAHYDALVELRKRFEAVKEAKGANKALHDQELRKLADDGKTTRAILKRKQGVPRPPGVVCIELKGIHAIHCIDSLSDILLSPSEFMVVSYLSREDKEYNTMIITDSAAWNAYQAFCCFDVFSGQDTSFDSGMESMRMPHASMIFQLLSSGSDVQLRIAFWILAHWYGYRGNIRPSRFGLNRSVGGWLDRVSMSLKFAMGYPLSPHVSEEEVNDSADDAALIMKALVLGLCAQSGVTASRHEELIKQTMADEPHSRTIAGRDRRPLANQIIAGVLSASVSQSSSAVDPTRYDNFDMQRRLGKPRTHASTFVASNEPGCSHDSQLGQLMLIELTAAERAYCGIETKDKRTLHCGEDNVKMSSGRSYHTCTCLFDFPLAIQKSSSNMKFVFTDSFVFIKRREYDLVQDVSDTYLWFERCFVDTVPAGLFHGGNKLRQQFFDPRATTTTRKSKKNKDPPHAVKQNPAKKTIAQLIRLNDSDDDDNNNDGPLDFDKIVEEYDPETALPGYSPASPMNS